MKTILYATDCSKYDIAILQYAYNLCEKFNANLVLLHVFSVPPIEHSTLRPHKYYRTQLQDEKLGVLKKYAQNNLIQNELKTEIKFEVIENLSVSSGILMAIQKIPPYLLIVGIKDSHTEREVFSGSIVKALMVKVNCTLLTIPNMQEFKEIKTIAYATDFEKVDVIAISKLSEMAELLDAKIKIVHIVNHNEHDHVEKMTQFKESLKEQVIFDDIEFQLISNRSIYDGLRNYINLNNTDIIALLERKDHSFFNQLFHRDLGKRMESKIKIPMLSFNQVNF